MFSLKLYKITILQDTKVYWAFRYPMYTGFIIVNEIRSERVKNGIVVAILSSKSASRIFNYNEQLIKNGPCCNDIYLL